MAKRKALAPVDGNVNLEPPAAKVSKTSNAKGRGKQAKNLETGTTKDDDKGANVAAAANGKKGGEVAPAKKVKKNKFSSAESLEKDFPDLVAICWPPECEGDDDESEDDEDDESEEGEAKSTFLDKDKKKEDEPTVPRKVTDKAYPVTRAGFEKFAHIVEEQEKRDPDFHNMYIYNDYSGYGTIEVLENFLMDFNKIVFEKGMSPLKKWAFIEGLVVWTRLGCLNNLMLNEDTESIEDIFNLISKLLLISLEILAEHNLCIPNDTIPNVGIITLMLIEFFIHDIGPVGYIDIGDVKEIVRYADKLGIVLESRKELKISDDEIEDLRMEYKEQKKAKPVAWKTEWKNYQGTDILMLGRHTGGEQYDITKMSEMEKKKYSFDNFEKNDSDEDK